MAPGATLTLVTRDGHVVSTASDSVAPPGGLLSFLPAAHVHAEAVTAAEESP